MTEKNNNEPHAQREKSENLSRNLSFSHHGWLKNGNPPGDLAKAPRCNARSKRTGQACRQPAMANRKCRLHGGLSTGPKTLDGRERSRKTRWEHGFYSVDAKQERKSLTDLLKETKELLKGM